jgi:hypothetical protein
MEKLSAREAHMINAEVSKFKESNYNTALEV